MSQGDDSQLNADPANDEECGNLKAWTGVEQLDEEGGCKPHNDQSDESAGKDDEELPAVKAADLAHSACRKGNCKRNSREDRVNGKRNISYFNL
ncbi:hypothetical protein D3C75_813820 [compost metagenome]